MRLSHAQTRAMPLMKPSPASLRIILWLVMMLACAVVAFLNSRFLWIDIRHIMHRAVHHLEHRAFWLYLHLYTAPLILVLGALLFLRAPRLRYPRLHRWLGRGYLLTIMATSGATLYLTLADPLFITRFGFGVLSALWFGTAAMAWWRAMQRQHEAHQHWMIRNYALTLTNVTFRAELHLMLLAGADFDAVYEPLRVLQWILNLLIAELLIRTGFLNWESWPRVQLPDLVSRIRQREA